MKPKRDLLGIQGVWVIFRALASSVVPAAAPAADAGLSYGTLAYGHPSEADILSRSEHA